MSTWNIGKDDVSEETQALKDRLSSKDSQCAGLQSQLMKRDAEFNELKSTLNETLHKLAREADRALHLESELNRCTEDLRNEKVSCQNIEAALVTAQEKIKAEELVSRELQCAIETLSHRSDGFSSNQSKLQREKAVLEARVRELEVDLRQLSAHPPSHPIQHRPGRPRSSSVNNFRVTDLERELIEVRALSAKREADLCSANSKLARVQTDVMKIENEKIAMEKQVQARMRDLEASILEKEEELESLKEQQEGESARAREEELLERVEEDEARIMALEMMLGDRREVEMIKAALQKAEQRLQVEILKADDSETRHVELVREKEEALDELEAAQRVIESLTEQLRETEARIDALSANEQNLVNRLASIKPVVDQQIIERRTEPGKQSTPGTSAEAVDATPGRHDEEAVATYIERLLAAIDRLRAERDASKRDLQFLETESKFAIEALEEKIAALVKSSGGRDGDVEALRVQLEQAAAREKENERQVKFSGLAATAAAVTIAHIQSQAELVTVKFLDVSMQLAAAQSELEGAEEKDATLADTKAKFEGANRSLEEKDVVLAELTAKLDVASRDLQAMELRRLDLVSEVSHLESREQEWAEKSAISLTAHKEVQATLEQTEAQLADATKSLEEAESQRGSLCLQITNLQTDLAAAQQELIDAEARYSSLQMHQLSSMSANDVTHALRDQIEELEMRVLRRTEQIGIHQHDIKRLETNLRLQEERIGEMTSELETLGAQKEAMVEDCADARDARDEAIQRVEALEMQVEGLEERVDQLETEREREAMAMVAVVADTVVHSKDVIRRAKETAAANEGKDAQRAIQAEFDRARALEDLANLRSDHKSTAELLERQTENLQSLQQFSQTLEDEARQATLALAMAHLDSRKIADCLRVSTDAEARLDSRVEEMQRLLNSRNLDEELRHLRTSHEAELATLQAQLHQTATELHGTEARLVDVEAAHRRALEEATHSARDLEDRVATLIGQVQSGEQLEHELARLRSMHADEVVRLQERLALAHAELEDAKRSKVDLEARHECLVDELVEVKEDLERHVARSSERAHAAAKQFENEFADLISNHGAKLGDLQAQLEHSTEEATRLQARLQEVSDVRAREQEMHQTELRSHTERLQQSESTHADLRQELATTRGQLVRTSLELESLQAEKSSLQIESTNLEAEIQRSISLTRFLESQVKESEGIVTSLKDALERTRAELSCSEKSGKAAEINLTLQAAKHDQIISGLRRELTTLRSDPRLEDVVAELREKNQEMEELLRSKCAEIEDNDDRFIEMLKEKKKLTTKIDSLTRKVLNLQSKLSAAKEAVPTSVSAPAVVSSSSRHTPPSAIPPVPPIPTHIPATPRIATARAVSGPSSLPRPKTPERRPSQPAVFKARTPERRMALETSLPETSSAGKKRRVPDDWEEENIAVQGFSADSRPEGAESTPRLRKALHSIHSGFTPIRHSASRPTASQSPTRRVTTGATALIADVTNSPRAAGGQTAKSSKRSWLGKIRGNGTTSQMSGRPLSSVRSGIFERIPGEAS